MALSVDTLTTCNTLFRDLRDQFFSFEAETETEKPWSYKMRPRLKSFGLRLRDQYRDWQILVSIDETDTETNDTQSQASRPRLKRGLIAKIETDTKNKSKHKEENLSN